MNQKVDSNDGDNYGCHLYYHLRKYNQLLARREQMIIRSRVQPQSIREVRWPVLQVWQGVPCRLSQDVQHVRLLGKDLHVLNQI